MPFPNRWGLSGFAYAALCLGLLAKKPREIEIQCWTLGFFSVWYCFEVLGVYGWIIVPLNNRSLQNGTPFEQKVLTAMMYYKDAWDLVSQEVFKSCLDRVS